MMLIGSGNRKLKLAEVKGGPSVAVYVKHIEVVFTGIDHVEEVSKGAANPVRLVSVASA